MNSAVGNAAKWDQDIRNMAFTMPMPLSEAEILYPCLGSKSAIMSICPPEGVVVTAFDNKLINICLMRRLSAIIRGSACLSVRK